MGLFDFLKKKNSEENHSSQSSDEAILKEIRKAQPWLGRVNFKDTAFADLLAHCPFVVVDNTGKKHVVLDKGRILADNNFSSIVYGSFVCWLRNVCLVNKNLYNNVFLNCFCKEDMYSSEEQKKRYISERLLKVNFDPVVDDVYLIVKGYTDSVFTIGKIAIKMIQLNATRTDEFASELNTKYESTKTIDGLFSNTELAEIFIRDLFKNTSMIKIDNN